MKRIALPLLLAASTSAQTVNLTVHTYPTNEYVIQFASDVRGPYSDLIDIWSPQAARSYPFSFQPDGSPMGFYRVKSVVPASNGPLTTWGMGTQQISYTHNDRPYPWYRDQGDTGDDAWVNCGPTSAEMACRWFNSNAVATAENARATYPDGDGWWWTYDVFNYLGASGVPVRYQTLFSASDLTNTLAHGSIAVLCLNMAYVNLAVDPLRVHAFYGGVTGHFIVAKGVRVTDSETWIECYDPFSMGEQYTDGTRKGQDRLYSMAELWNAISNYWQYAMVVDPPGTPKSQTMFEPPPQHGGAR